MSDDRPRRVRVEGDLFHPRVPAGAVYVGRAAPGLRRSPWANPHRVGTCRVCQDVEGGTVEHDQADAVRAYTADLRERPALYEAVRVELAGRHLACWCRQGPCHGEVLLAVANDVDVDVVSPS